MQETNDQGVFWRSHPIRDNFPGSILAIIAFSGILILIHFAWQEWLFTIIAVIVLTYSLKQYFFPTSYFLNARGLRLQCLLWQKEYQWSYFKNFYTHKIGIHLSPYDKSSYLDSFRGVFLRFNNNHQQVTDFIKGIFKSRAASREDLADATHD